jgi:mannose/fructose/N-acetylgalactosamine-specific phosphotransferase system component IIC
VNAPLALALTVLWGGVVAVDTAAFLQVLVSQPLVAGSVVGLVWGRVDVGLEMGALLQLFALNVLPVGGRTPEDFAVGTVVGTATAAVLSQTDPVAAAQGGPLVYGLLIAFATALGGKAVITWVRHRNEGLARWVEERLGAGELAALGRAQRAGIGLAFAVGVAWTAAALAIATLLGRVAFAHDSIAFGSAYRDASPLLWGFGAGSVARGLSRGRKPAAVFWLALVAFVAMRLWTGA